MNVKSILAATVSIFIGVIVLSGCPPKKKLEIMDKPNEDVNISTETAVSPTPDIEEFNPNIEVKINQDWSEIGALSIVNFDYDSAQVNDAQRAVLKKNVAVLKKLPKSVSIRVEGHCDDRGTIEYNIALGQKRGDSVRSFYAAAGISASRIKTISFGEERPLCADASDACWAKNRRSATTVRNDETLILKTDTLQ